MGSVACFLGSGLGPPNMAADLACSSACDMFGTLPRWLVVTIPYGVIVPMALARPPDPEAMALLEPVTDPPAGEGMTTCCAIPVLRGATAATDWPGALALMLEEPAAVKPWLLLLHSAAVRTGE